MIRVSRELAFCRRLPEVHGHRQRLWAEPAYAELLLDMQKRVHDYVVADKGTAQEALDLLVRIGKRCSRKKVDIGLMSCRSPISTSGDPLLERVPIRERQDSHEHSRRAAVPGRHADWHCDSAGCPTEAIAVRVFDVAQMNYCSGNGSSDIPPNRNASRRGVRATARSRRVLM